MYVALTRARHQLVLWWGRADQCRHSPLGRLLMGRDPRTGAVGEARAHDPRDEDIRRALATLLDRTPPGLIATEMASDAGAHGAEGGLATAPDVTLHTAQFDRVLDLRWRRASYTSITAQATDSTAQGVTSEPEDPGVDDEPPAPDERVPREQAECPLAALPAGAEFGTFVHRVMEQIDFTAADFSAISSPTPLGVDLDVLAAGLSAALATPLGPLVSGGSLGAIQRRDRVDELRFELPLVGGDRPTGQLSTSDLASLLATHLPASGPLSGYPARLTDPLLETELRGYLTGSLDLVFRHPAPDGLVRWYVADYKTNWLGPWATDYRGEVLDAEMQRHHYPLQALLYLVALHRYLRWRLAGYAPDEHLGGVLYLFLRGMVGPATPDVGGRPCGVFSWAPPAQLIVELSDLFAAGSP
jgi:exodeoxyribonuclease V beta subunit